MATTTLPRVPYSVLSSNYPLGSGPRRSLSLWEAENQVRGGRRDHLPMGEWVTTDRQGRPLRIVTITYAYDGPVFQTHVLEFTAWHELVGQV
jgi:hypothetical protein